MYYTFENFIDRCDDMMIAEEARLSYKLMRKAQTNTLALNNQLSQQRKLCASEYEQAKKDGTLDAFFTKIEKKKANVQRKINGTEIKNKNALQKFVALYDEYLKKRSSTPSNESSTSFFNMIFDEEVTLATESTSFFDMVFDDEMTIAQEARLTAAQRKSLPDNAFGLPSLRKYPLIVKNEKGEYEWTHLNNAIAFFHTCKDESQKKELATNIAKVIKKYKVDVKISEKNNIRKYAKFD